MFGDLSISDIARKYVHNFCSSPGKGEPDLGLGEGYAVGVGAQEITGGSQSKPVKISVTAMGKDLDTIIRYLDLWVSKHGNGEYGAEDFVPPKDHKSDSDPGIQQIRREIKEFVRLVLLKGLDNTILEIGLGKHGGTHMLWRCIFNQVITIEIDPERIKNFKQKEPLDSRSIIIEGSSEDPAIRERVRACADSVDVLFIDGNHTYESVASDWAMYHNLVRPGGIIAFHDSHCTNVPDWGAAKFVEDLAKGIIDNKPHKLYDIVYSLQAGISYEECGERAKFRA